MKAFKQTVRKYYKYQDTAWIRPNLTANGVLGADAFAVSANGQYSGTYAIFKAVDGNNSTGWEVSSPTSAYYIFYNPKPLKLTSIKMRNWTGSGNIDASKGGKVYGANDGNTWTELVTYTNTSYSSGAEWNIDMSSVSDAYTYYKITCTDGTGNNRNYWNVAEMTPIGSEQTAVEGTPSDYDFYEDVDEYKLLKQTVRNYYKYTTPNLTVVGSPVINDGIMSGFSSSNYGTYPTSISLGTNDFEMVFKVKPEGTGQVIPIAQTGVQFNTSLLIMASAIYFRARNNSGNAFAFSVNPSVTLSTTSFTYIKITRNGNNFDISIKNENDSSYSSINTFTSSASIQSVTNLGGFNDSGLGWQTGNGSIALKESYIKVIGGNSWKGMNYTESTPSDYDFYKDVDTYSAFNI